MYSFYSKNICSNFSTINSNIADLGEMTLDYANMTSRQNVTTYTANKKCRIYFYVYGTTSFFSNLINNISIVQQNTSLTGGMPRAYFTCDLNAGDVFSTVVHSGSIEASSIVVIPYK